MVKNTPSNNRKALEEALKDLLQSGAWSGAKSVGTEVSQQAVGAVQGLHAASGAIPMAMAK